MLHYLKYEDLASRACRWLSLLPAEQLGAQLVKEHRPRPLYAINAEQRSRDLLYSTS